MLQKTKINLIFLMVGTMTFIVCSYFTYLSLSPLMKQLTLTDWLMVATVLGTLFVVVDTVEVILMRQGQRKWTHTPGQTLIAMINDGYDELAKNQEAQQKLMVLAANIGEAFMSGGVGDVDGEAREVGGRIVLPDKYKSYERFVNQPLVRPWVKSKLKSLFAGGEKAAKVAKPGEVEIIK